MRHAATVLTGLAVLAALAGCNGPDVTAARLDAAVPSTFAHLYARQQNLLGHGGVTEEWASPTATCSPPGGAGASAGSEWTCTLLFRAGDGTVTTVGLDVRTRAEGCFTAQGPATLLGPAVLDLPGGGTAPNPALAFDGCFDPAR